MNSPPELFLVSFTVLFLFTIFLRRLPIPGTNIYVYRSLAKMANCITKRIMVFRTRITMFLVKLHLFSSREFIFFSFRRVHILLNFRFLYFRSSIIYRTSFSNGRWFDTISLPINETFFLLDLFCVCMH